MAESTPEGVAFVQPRPGRQAAARVGLGFPLDRPLRICRRHALHEFLTLALDLHGEPLQQVRPPPGEDLVQRMDGFPDLETINLLISRGLSHVSVNCALYCRRPCSEVIDLLEALPTVRLVAGGCWEGAPVRLHELVR